MSKAQYPAKCPITQRNFFMVVDGIPTYGGPFDSYTIPYMGGSEAQPLHDRELTTVRYDHDRGMWGDHENVPLRIISEDALYELLYASEENNKKSEGNPK